MIPQPLWVGAPAMAVKAQGWRYKYRMRRRLCPTVEQWQERIVPRLQPEDWPGFLKVRGRVASSYALNKILSGDDAGSRYIVAKYGAEMPANVYTNLMNLGNQSRWMIWKVLCSLLRLQDHARALYIHYQG
jgi:hypothetical protein